MTGPFGTSAASCILGTVLGYTPPQPRFWKALLVCAPVVALVAWSLQFFRINVPSRIVMAGAVVAWLLLAATVQARVTNDWRTQYQLDRSNVNREMDTSRAARTDEED